MKRKLKKLVALVLMLAISVNVVLPAGAATTPGDYDALISELGRTFDLFKELGFDYDSLTKIIDMGVRGEDFWGAPETSYVMSDEDLQKLESANLTIHNEYTIANKLSTAIGDETVPDMEFDIQPRDGDPYDGNPPYTEEEQAERMMYIWGVYNKYYSAPKYNPDTYLVYLYMSHYTENMNYDRTAEKPNFDSIYAHIISNNDIVAVAGDYIQTIHFLTLTSFIDIKTPNLG